MGDIFRLSVIPAAILLLSLDGIRGIGPDRHVEVTRSAVLDMTPDEIRRTIIGHGYPDEGRSAWLKLFPRPVHVDSPSLEVGARHTAHMEYRRWGLPGFNVHRGTLVMEFTQNTDERLAARFVHDDSYLSHYMTFKTWEMRMEPQSDGRTQITLAVTYDRDVAPAWYFGPPMRKAVADGLDYALSDILAGDR